MTRDERYGKGVSRKVKRDKKGKPTRRAGSAVTLREVEVDDKGNVIEPVEEKK